MENQTAKTPCLPGYRIRLSTRIGASNPTSCRGNENHLRTTKLLARFLHLHLMATLGERVAHVRGDSWLDPESLTAIPTEPRRLDRLLRR
jgi:hypothetical protein